MNKLVDDLLAKHNIRRSLSRPGTPYDNSEQENFFSCLKREKIRKRKYRYIDEVKKDVNDYVNLYNTGRPHSRLEGKYPITVLAEYYQQFKHQA